MNSNKQKHRIFSGIQPSGNIHIGNYLGAIRHWVAAQQQYENLFCVVDLHSITVPQDPAVLKGKIREIAAILFAAGIDPELSSVFVQSHISAHCELAWILNCFIPLGQMQRMTQFKEKSEALKGKVSVGLLDYPALMAADILLYETDLVPVGEDQKQHLELTRDVARRFNGLHGDTFKIPEPVIAESGARIMGLDDPEKKMSKSETKSGHAINLLDSPDEIREKIKRATTDSLKDITFDPNRPGIFNLLIIYELFSGQTRPEIEARFAGKGYAQLKEELAEIVIEVLRPLQERYHRLIADPADLNGLLADSVRKLEPIAEKTLTKVQEKVGLG